MTKIFKAFLVVVTFLLSFTTYAQQTDLLFKAGNDHYAQGRYQEAIDAYKRILDQKVESAALYYNLANANYKLNNVAPTIYYYEKALQLAPSDPDIRNNAAFAENMKIDAIESLPAFKAHPMLYPLHIAPATAPDLGCGVLLGYKK